MINQYITRFFITAFFFSTVLIAQSQSTVALTATWGNFGDKPGELKFPTMIAADKKGNVYVVDQHNHRIQLFDSTGTYITSWGKQGQEQGSFYYPYGIAIDSKGNVFVSDMNNNRVQKFTADGRYLASVGSYGTANGQMKYPRGIAIDGNDVLYVIDAYNYRIQTFNSDLKFLSTWGSAESIGIKLYMPQEIAITKEGNIIMSDRQNHRIAVFTTDGKLVKRFGDYAEGADARGGLFSEPHGIAVAANGDIFISDRYNFRIQQFDAANNYQTQWLTPGVFDDSKHFPLGIAVYANTVYVADHYSHTIQRYKLIAAK